VYDFVCSGFQVCALPFPRFFFFFFSHETL